MRNLLILFIIGLLVLSCTTSHRPEGPQIVYLPEWTYNIPSEPGYIYAVGNAGRMFNEERQKRKALQNALKMISLELLASTFYKVKVEEYKQGRLSQYSYAQVYKSLATGTISKLKELEVVDEYWEDKVTHDYFVLVRLKITPKVIQEIIKHLKKSKKLTPREIYRVRQLLESL